jgi:hypothetical protein
LLHHFRAIVVPQHFFKHLVSAIVSASIILFIGNWGSHSSKKNAFGPNPRPSRIAQFSGGQSLESFLSQSARIYHDDKEGVLSHPPENSDNLRELREQLRQDSRDSFQLLENFWDNPICSIIHDEPNHCIIVVWKQYATQIQLRFIHENLLTLICKHRVNKILATTQLCLPSLRRTDSGSSTSGFRRAVECGPRFAASKRPDSYFGKLAVSHIHSAAPVGIECRSFEQLHEAREWLDTVAAG